MATGVGKIDVGGKLYAFTGTVTTNGSPVTVYTMPNRKFLMIGYTATDAIFQVTIASGSTTIDSGTDSSVAFTAYCVEIFDTL